jgi:hypothetical protein
MKVELRAARIPIVGTIAHHHWLVVWEGDAVLRWEVWQRRHAGGEAWGHLHCNLLPFDRGVGNGPSWRVCAWTGAPAAALAERLARAPRDYPWRHRYLPWPGPNSNTFVQWVLEDRHRLSWHGIGRRFRGLRRLRP